MPNGDKRFKVTYTTIETHTVIMYANSKADARHIIDLGELDYNYDEQLERSKELTIESCEEVE